MRFIFQSDRWRSKGIICRKAEITLRQQGKQERSARPRKRDGLPRAPLLGELSNEVRLRGCTEQPLPVSRNWLSLWESWQSRQALTERAPKTFFKKSRKKVKGICVSCIIESETAKIQHKTA